MLVLFMDSFHISIKNRVFLNLSYFNRDPGSGLFGSWRNYGKEKEKKVYSTGWGIEPATTSVS